MDNSGVAQTIDRSEVRAQIFRVVRETKWLILQSALIAVILYLPDQMREIYRIAVVEGGWLGAVEIAVPVVLICFIVWLGAALVAAEADTRTSARSAERFAFALPAVLGTLPLVAFAAGLYFAVPAPPPAAAADAGARAGAALIRNRALLPTELLPDAGGLLRLMWLMAALVLPVLASQLLLMRLVKPALQAVNNAYFKRWLLLPLSIGLVVAAAAVFYAYPVPLPRALGVVGMLALFMVCLASITVHLSLLSREHRWPLVAVPLALAILFSMLDLNDNHRIRLIAAEQGQPQPAKRPPLAEEEFVTWYNAHSASVQTAGEYPVYVVAAQGGGIYAAYQTAIFLARMQDVCPEFKDHLFAISSVSGGSVGAAIFTAALHNVAEADAAASPVTAPAPEPAAAAPAAADTGTAAEAPAVAAPVDPCPRVTAFLGSGKPADLAELKQPGKHEAEVKRILSQDFLSPLIGAFLFTDFSQRFLPYPFGALDRARALEAGFEAAATPPGKPGPGPLAQSFLAHWDASAKGGPALLVNATDAASGRRMVIAPFSIQSAFPSHRKAGIMTFPFWQTLENGVTVEKPLDIRLSTAAGISARFPWVTPAATVPAANVTTGKTEMIRLVDGGYIDNSGVETALDLIRNLSAAVARINLGNPVDAGEDAPAPTRSIKLQLISLSGGDYPTRASYALGETLEPVRAMFSAREARAYVAIERAGEEMPIEPLKLDNGTDGAGLGSTPEPLTVSNLHVSKLASRFYELPLGWSLGNDTRRVIESQSGNLWQCKFGMNFEQSDDKASQADCIQLLIYHQLRHSLPQAAAAVVAALNKAPLAPGERLDNEAFFACYGKVRGSELTGPQKRTLQAILSIWDENPQWQDDRMLATLLAVLALETSDFRFQEERTSVDVANKRYGEGGMARALGNTRPDDGWRFRGRGLLQITGRSNYRNIGRAIGFDLEDAPDMLLNPELNAKAAINFIFRRGGVRSWEKYFSPGQVDYEGIARAHWGRGMPSALRTEKAQVLSSKSQQLGQCVADSRRK
jgi:hypothetical protein